jgi:nucleotide-binding universal stress UspA family protein
MNPPTSSVIVPLDGSERAERALGPAVQLADRMEASLVLMSASPEPHAVKAVEEYLDERVCRLQREAHPILVLDRAAPDAILVVANEPGALVCMTTHGRTGVLRAALGSVAEAVVRGARGPVVLVGPHCRPDWELPEVPELIAGFDNSDCARAGVRAAGDLALALNGRVRVLEVASRPDLVGKSYFTLDDIDALNEAVGELRATGVHVDYEIIEGVDEADSLLDAAVRSSASLISLGTHGRQGIARIVLGSVTARIVRSTSVPVMVACA